jgi:DNA-binding response OmpR family regulator
MVSRDAINVGLETFHAPQTIVATSLQQDNREREETMNRILVVEDQKRLLNSLRRGLEEEGFEVIGGTTGEEGYYLATTQSPSVVVLDLMLPKRDGMQVLRDLRGQGHQVPVLILTARDAVEDRVAGLEAGADDYLVKPFAFAELVARLRVLLRRNLPARETVLRADDLEMDLLGRRVVRGGIEIELSQREFELLEYLLRRKNETVTRDMLSRDVWKEPDGVLTNVIDVCVSALRKRIERPGQHQLVQTVRGVGYVLRDR